VPRARPKGLFCLLQFLGNAIDAPPRAREFFSTHQVTEPRDVKGHREHQQIDRQECEIGDFLAFRFDELPHVQVVQSERCMTKTVSTGSDMTTMNITDDVRSANAFRRRWIPAAWPPEN